MEGPKALDGGVVVKPAKAPPKSGWRKLVHGVTGGRVNPGASPREQELNDLTELIRTPLRGDYRIAVMSLKAAWVKQQRRWHWVLCWRKSAGIA